jgi:signal transduction histidine kinase
VFSTTLYYIDRQEIETGLKSQIQHFNKDVDYKNDSQQIYNLVLRQRSKNLAIKVLYYDIIFILASILVSYFLAKRTLRPIEQAYEAQTQFVAEASHQLRTPLANMQLATEVALLKAKKATNKDYEVALKQNLKDISKLSNLTEKLLNIARQQSSIVKFDRERINVSEVINACAERLGNIAKQNNVSLKVSGHKSIIFADKEALEQTFIILIENAIKYSKPNSEVEIVVLSDYRKVIVKIIDYGIGIKGSDLQQIFQPFYRSSDTNAQQVAGFGLGLALAKQVVEAHGGEIRVSSKVGHGSVFTVYLPS